MYDEREKVALDALDALGIKYTRYEHETAHTMQDCEGIGSELGAKHFKNLFLTNRQQTEFYMLLIAPDKKFRTAEVSKKLGVARLSFGTDELLFSMLSLLPGSVTPLALVNDKQGQITLVIDSDILDYPMVCMHPMVSNASVAISGADFLRFVNSLNNPVVRLNIDNVPIDIG